MYLPRYGYCESTSRGCNCKWLNPSLAPHSAGVVMVGGESGRCSFVVGGAGLELSVAECSVASKFQLSGKDQMLRFVLLSLGTSREVFPHRQR